MIFRFRHLGLLRSQPADKRSPSVRNFSVKFCRFLFKLRTSTTSNLSDNLLLAIYEMTRERRASALHSVYANAESLLFLRELSCNLPPRSSLLFFRPTSISKERKRRRETPGGQPRAESSDGRGPFVTRTMRKGVIYGSSRRDSVTEGRDGLEQT